MYRTQYQDFSLITDDQRRPKLFDLLSTDETQEEISWSSVLSRLRTHPHEASWFVPGSASNLVPGGYYHTHYSCGEYEEEEEEPTVGWTALHTTMYLAPPARVICELLNVFPYAAKIESARGDTPLHLVSFVDITPQVTEIILEKAGVKGVFRRNAAGSTPLDIMCGWWSANVPTFGEECGGIDHYKPYDGGLSEEEEEEKDVGVDWKRRVFRNEEQNVNQWEKLIMLLKAASTSLDDNDVKEGRKKFQPLHTAARLGCNPEVLWHLNESTGREAIRERDEDGRTPLALAASSTYFHPCSSSSEREGRVIAQLIQLYPYASQIPDSQKRLPLHLALESGKSWNGGCIKQILHAAPQVLHTRDVTTFLYPFMMAAVEPGCLDTIYELLRSAPTLASGLADDPPWIRLEKRLGEKMEKKTMAYKDEICDLKGTVLSLQMEVDKLKQELACVKEENEMLKENNHNCEDDTELEEFVVDELTLKRSRNDNDEYDSTLEEILRSGESMETEAKKPKCC